MFVTEIYIISLLLFNPNTNYVQPEVHDFLYSFLLHVKQKQLHKNIKV